MSNFSSSRSQPAVGLAGFVFLAIIAAMFGAGYSVGRYVYRRTGNWLLGRPSEQPLPAGG